MWNYKIFSLFLLNTRKYFIDLKESSIRSRSKELNLLHKDRLPIGEDLTEGIYINQEVHQGCSIPLTLFNIYIDEIASEWTLLVDLGIKIQKKVTGMLF